MGEDVDGEIQCIRAGVCFGRAIQNGVGIYPQERDDEEPLRAEITG